MDKRKNYDCLKNQLDISMGLSGVSIKSISIEPRAGEPKVEVHGEGGSQSKDGKWDGWTTADVTINPRDDGVTDVMTMVRMEAPGETAVATDTPFGSPDAPLGIRVTPKPVPGSLAREAKARAIDLYHGAGRALNYCGPWPQTGIKGPQPK